MIICLAATSGISAPMGNSLGRRRFRGNARKNNWGAITAAIIRAWRINGLNREDKEPIIAEENKTENRSSIPERPEGLEKPKTITLVDPPAATESDEAKSSSSEDSDEVASPAEESDGVESPAEESDGVESPAEDPAEATLSPEVFDQVGFLLKTLLAPLEN
jgi:hypothetical protein